MRIRVDHRTTYSYALPASNVVQALRLSPRDHDGQYIRDWRVDVDVNGSLREGVDCFGNRLTIFYAEAPLTELTISVTGEATVSDTGGVISAPEFLPPAIFLRSTPLTEADVAIADLARRCLKQEPLASLHALMAALHDDLSFDTSETDVATPAATALAAGGGVCQDFAHIFVSAARSLRIPARYVSGHLGRSADAQQDAAHAWAEALIPDLGWVAFDPANGICTTDAYLRVAVGLDYADAAPIRGARRGGGEETMHVQVHAAEAIRQRQS